MKNGVKKRKEKKRLAIAGQRKTVENNKYIIYNNENNWNDISEVAHCCPWSQSDARGGALFQEHKSKRVTHLGGQQ